MPRARFQAYRLWLIVSLAPGRGSIPSHYSPIIIAFPPLFVNKKMPYYFSMRASRNLAR